MIATLVSNIKTRVAAVLTSAYSEMPIGILPEENGKRMTAKRYAVVTGSAIETGSVNCYYTMDQTFTIKLTDHYVKRAGDDSAKQSATLAIMDKFLDIYKDLVNTKAGTPASVMNVKDLNIDSPQYFENEDSVLIEASVVVTYRVAL